MDRRVAIKWMLAAAATLSLRGVPHASATEITANGYGQDPDLLRDYKPGDVWPLTFTATERRACTALCDVIIPADDHSPSAATIGVPEFIDEWVSAPYPDQRRDRTIVVEGLAWLDAEAQRRFQADFAAASEKQKTALCDDICHTAMAKDEFKKAARFFARFRDLTATGFYTTPEGIKDLGHIGNMPLPRFDGPPPEALRRLGLV